MIKHRIKNKYILIDDEDFWVLEKYKFSINTQGYVITEIGNRKMNTRKILSLHRIIIQPKAYEIIDHINRNKLDNRKCNLRIANKSTNGMNRSCQSNSTTMVKGVSWSNQKNKYRIYCSVNGKQYHLGYAKSLTKALEIYKKKINKYHGEFACV